MAYYASTNENNRLMFGTPGIVISGVLMLVMAILSYCLPQTGITEGNQGICLPSPNLWDISELASFLLNIALIGIVALVVLLLNKRFNFIQSHTALFAAAFLIITGSNPWLTFRLSSSVLFALVILIAVWILFNLYDSRNATVGVFLLFSTLAFGAMVQYAFVLMIPIFLIGTMYMKVLRVKEFVAMLLGLAAPFWIVFGFGIVDFDDFSMPTLTNLFNNITSSLDRLWLFIYVGLTVLIALLLAFVNAGKVFAASSQIRAYNSFINLLGIALAWYMVFDYKNILVYIVAFNLIAGIQIAHFFSGNRIYYDYLYYGIGVAAYIALFSLIIYA